MAVGDEHSWQARIDVGAAALLTFLDEHGSWAQLVALEAPASGAAVAKCTERVYGALKPVFEQARETVIVGAEIKPPPRLIAELVVLACVSVIRARMLRADGRPLNELERSLSLEIIDPYLRRAAERLDQTEAGDQRAEMVPIRPHPRTIPALSAIAAKPGLNSGEVGREVGIDNSGHVSGLLRRFERRGLIENAAARQARSAERAWFLTPYGQRILQLLTKRFEIAQRLQEFPQGQASA